MKSKKHTNMKNYNKLALEKWNSGEKNKTVISRLRMN